MRYNVGINIEYGIISKVLLRNSANIVLACLSKTSPFVEIEGLACPLKVKGPRYIDRAKVA
jgi:hypothetical protein